MFSYYLFKINYICIIVKNIVMRKSVLKTVYLLIVFVSSALYVNAQCTTNAGSMNQTEPVYLCDNQCSEVEHSGGVLDENDILEFVLFYPNMPTQVLARKSTPDFCLSDIPDGQYGITYHIAARAGNNLSGIVDTDDPCMHQSNPFAITWYNTPTAEVISEQVEVCGNCVDLQANTTGIEGNTYYWIPKINGAWENPEGAYSANATYCIYAPASFGDFAHVDAKFIWVVRKGNCIAVDTMNVTFYQRPQANAGLDNAVCGYHYDLQAEWNIAPSSTYNPSGVWSQISPPGTPANIYNYNNPNSHVVVNTPGVWQFVFKENNTHYTSCYSTDTVQIEFVEVPIVEVGEDQDVCGNCITLENGLNGTWLPGNYYFDPVTNQACVNTYGTTAFIWQESNYATTQSLTCNYLDSVNITFWRKPTPNILTDPADSIACGLTYYNLMAEEPNEEITGYWYCINAGIQYGDKFSHNTWAKVPYYGYYDFYWRELTGPNLTSGFCTDTAGPLRIHFVEPPIANAGGDTIFCGLTGQLNAIPSIGTGTWSTSSTEYISFEDINDPNTTITSTIINTENPDQPYFEVIWTENYTNGCTDADTIKVVFATASNSYSEQHSICEGEIYSWNGQNYTETGTYTAELTNVYGCDSIITLNLTVNPIPEQVIISQSPENGILTEGTSGSITLENSIIETNYWVSMGGEPFTEEFTGTGSELSLGDNFLDGSYDIRSRNQYGCSLVQGIANFVTEVSGTNKIVANVSFGTPASNFPANHVNVKLYKATTDNETIVLVAEQLLGSNGYVEFTDLETGDYYLGSFIQYPDDYDVVEHIYYQTAVVHEDAISIPIAEETLFIANLHHVLIAESQGSNEMQGIVGATTNQKSLNPLKDMVVVLRNTDINEIIGVSVTNDNGQYHFDNITDNVNIQAFVTSFEHQDWIAFEKETGVDQTYNINFIVDGTSIYPQVSGVFEDIQIQNIEFTVFPNPAREVLYINCDVEKAILQIFDINGKLIYTDFVFSNSEINISELISGTYIIILSAENERIGVQKFIKE